MNRLKGIMLGLALLLSAQKEVLAATSAGSYSGGVLIGVFTGFCVLLVVLQMVPTLMMLIGALKGACGKNSGRKLGQGV